MAARWLALVDRWRRGIGRIRTRLLVVNLLVVLVPIAGLEFARLYERQLLDALERDMQNQAVLVKVWLEAALTRGEAFGTPEQEAQLTVAALQTRTRIRLVDAEHGVLVDSHRNGPPEGKEPRAPLFTRERAVELEQSLSVNDRRSSAHEPELPLEKRPELVGAFAGKRSTATRVARRPPSVFLFLAEPVRVPQGGVRGAVYVTRSTSPVLQEMHRIRRGLTQVLALAFAFTAAVTLLLAWTISRPLERLAHAARRIAAGDSALDVPVAGGGEISELAEAFREMTRKLEARHRYISAFAADVAHEFKSPLTSIRGAAELLAEGAADDLEARKRFLENIALDAARLDRLVSRLLELSRIDASEESPVLVDLESLVRRAVERSQGPDGGVVLDYAATLTLSAPVEEALRKGVPVYFVAQATVYRPRWYWRDEKISRVSRSWRLSFQPLTSAWRVSLGAFSQSYPSLEEALTTVTRSARWRIAESGVNDPNEKYYVEFKFELDSSQLPRPMQLDLAAQAEWHLGVERTIQVE